MAKYTWSKGVSGDWSAAGNWQGGVAPNAADADVEIVAAPAASSGGYKAVINAGSSEVVRSLDLGGSAVGLEVDGTLTFAPGSTGALGREFQSSNLSINNGTVENAGLMFTFIQTTGNVLFTGQNPIYIAWELQVLEGTATVDTASIAQYDAAKHTLFDGAFEALGGGRVINLGGARGGFTLDIETLTGPKPSPEHSYWTQLIYDDPGSQINEWNGTAYVPVESTLKRIENSAYVSVTEGRGYTTSNALTIGKDGVFEQAGGTLHTGGLTLENGGLLVGGMTAVSANPSSGQATVEGAVTNNGQMVAMGPGLVFRDAVTGTGEITFNRTAPLPGFDIPVAPAVSGTLEVGAVGAGQTVRMVGSDTLVLDRPAAFAAVITDFDSSDTIRLKTTAAPTSASYTATGTGTGTLTVSAGATTLATLTLAGNYAGQSFNVAPTAAGGAYALTLGPASGGSGSGSGGSGGSGGGTTSGDPLFDSAFYLSHNPDVARAGVDPYKHYLTYGWKEGRDPSALFSTSYYLGHNPDVAQAKLNPLLHFEQYGAKEGRAPNPFFDTRYYLAQNPDVRRVGMNALQHFQEYGWKEGREPSLLFSDAKYLAANPDVKAAGTNPLLDYITVGQAQGRMTFLSGSTAPADPLVSAAYYDKQLGATLLPTGDAAEQQAAASYDATGWKQGLNPDAFFDTRYYLSHNPDVAAAHMNPLKHYEQYGWKEDRDPSAQFSTTKYLAAYSDVKAAGVNPLLDYVQTGQAQGRTAFAA